MFVRLSVCASILLGSVVARGGAGPDGSVAYALLVGSNRPGQGQQALRFAGQDVLRVQKVLTELGGYAPQRVQALLDPDRGSVLAALEALSGQLEAHRRQDEKTVFLFYYSGHARARALNLGPEALDLAELKRWFEGLPATVTLVVLDACQTGAISRVKGVEPVADFSHNSVAGLNTAGLVVMASSAADELSQESERLGGSFFTHHLVTGLRGAADADGDGRVTLNEAYRYAYNRTLVSTAATAVGRQHVTLETELRGKGEMVLTRPAQATARLAFPAHLAAEVLVMRSDSQTVVAEVHKAKASALTLALPPADYSALVRRSPRVQRCELTLSAGRVTELDPDPCPEVALDEAEVKGEAEAAAQPVETLALEAAIGGVVGRRDGYVRTLEDFGFDESGSLFSDWPDLHFDVSVTWSFHRYAALVLTFGNLDNGAHNREIEQMNGDFRPQSFVWQTWRVGLSLRTQLPLCSDWIVPYLQTGGGVGIGTTEFTDGDLPHSETHAGYYLSVAGGLQVMPNNGRWRHIGLFSQVEYVYAPVIDNLAGDTHDSGGPAIVSGIRGAF